MNDYYYTIEDLRNNRLLFNNDTEKIRIESFSLANTLDSLRDKMYEQKVEIIELNKSGKTGHLGLYNGKFIEVYYLKSN